MPTGDRAPGSAADAGADVDVDVESLEQERQFLLRSLADLDAEHVAGDLDDDDYRTLTDQYTARAAAVLRALEAAKVAKRRAKAVGGGAAACAAPGPCRPPGFWGSRFGGRPGPGGLGLGRSGHWLGLGRRYQRHRQRRSQGRGQGHGHGHGQGRGFE